MNIEKLLRELRFSDANHLGMGDIRLTLGDQQDIIATHAKLLAAAREAHEAIDNYRGFEVAAYECGCSDCLGTIHEMREEVDKTARELKAVIAECEEEE